MAAQLALKGNVRTLGESGDERSQPPERDTSMPLGAGFSSSGVILP